LFDVPITIDMLVFTTSLLALAKLEYKNTFMLTRFDDINDFQNRQDMEKPSVKEAYSIAHRFFDELTK
jgi:hypothetical protein